MIRVNSSLFGSSSKGKSSDDNSSNPVPQLYVTSGSTFKLNHIKTNTNLNLPQVSYGTGSQQQAITALSSTSSGTKSFWIIEPVIKVKRGTPVDCGTQIRLVNSDSMHNLHSHSAHKAPISGAQEVSGFEGRDAGDLWTAECTGRWVREAPVVLRHVETGRALQVMPGKKYGQPIAGQLEVSCGKSTNADAQWRAMEGFYFN
ncbi:hypothetical protein GGF37_001386 [Kickxella alabastrina]|nr:hypothetical protein GGF37_001386 [Kickxella alabastrina]